MADRQTETVTTELNLDALVHQLYSVIHSAQAILMQLGAPVPGSSEQQAWSGETIDPKTCEHPPEARGENVPTMGNLDSYICRACGSIYDVPEGD